MSILKKINRIIIKHKILIFFLLAIAIFGTKLANRLVKEYCIVQTESRDREIAREWKRGSSSRKSEFEILSKNREIFILFFEDNSVKIKSKKSNRIVYALTIPDDSPKFDLPMSIEAILVTKDNWLFIRTRLNNYLSKVIIDGRSIRIEELIKIPELRSRQCNNFYDWFGGCNVSPFLYNSESDKVFITGYERKKIGYELKQIAIDEGKISTINQQSYYLCSGKENLCFSYKYFRNKYAK